MTVGKYFAQTKTEVVDADDNKSLNKLFKWSYVSKYWLFIILLLVLIGVEYFFRFTQFTILLKLPLFAITFYLVLLHLNIKLMFGNFCASRTLEVKIIYAIIGIYFIGLTVIEIKANQHRNFFYLLYILPLLGLILLLKEGSSIDRSVEAIRYRFGIRLLSLISICLAIVFYVMLMIFNGTDYKLNLFLYNPLQQIIIGLPMLIWLNGYAKFRLDNYRTMLSYHWLLSILLFLLSLIALYYMNNYLVGQNDYPAIILLIAAIIVVVFNAVLTTSLVQSKKLTMAGLIEISSFKGMIFAFIVAGCVFYIV